MSRRGRLVLSLSLLGLLTSPGLAQVPIDTLVLQAQTRFLSDDLLEGRGTGTRGGDLAAAYIESQCREFGLLPLGETYEQAVPLEEAVLDSGSLTITTSGQTAQFSYPSQFTPNVGTREALRDFGGPAFYLGPAEAVASPSLDGLALGGRVAVVVGARISADALEVLAEMGVVGLVQLIPDPRAYDLYRVSRGSSRLYHADGSVPSSFLPSLPTVLAGPQVTRSLLAGSHVAAGDFETAGSLGREVRYEIAVHRRPVAAANVACMLSGRRAASADTAIMFAAHYDHLGIGVPDTAQDSIYNGFADNAAGVAMVLAIGKALAQSGGLRHSVLFLFPVGEERGLLGSDFYVANPLWPLERTMAVINLDAGAPAGRPVTWELAGVDSTGLGAVAISVAASHGWAVKTSHPRPNSDYFAFTRKGIPGVLIIPGQGPYEGLTADSSDALRHRWRYYHDPQDEWRKDFPYVGLVRYASFAYLIAEAIDGELAR